MQTVIENDHLVAIPSSDAQSTLAQNIMSEVRVEKHLCSQHAQLILVEEGQAW